MLHADGVDVVSHPDVGHVLVPAHLAHQSGDLVSIKTWLSSSLSDHVTHPGVQVVECVLLHLLTANLLHQEAELPVPLDQLLLLGVWDVLTFRARTVQSPPCCVNRPRCGTFWTFDTLLQGIAPSSNHASKPADNMDTDLLWIRAQAALTCEEPVLRELVLPGAGVHHGVDVADPTWNYEIWKMNSPSLPRLLRAHHFPLHHHSELPALEHHGGVRGAGVVQFAGQQVQADAERLTRNGTAKTRVRFSGLLRF